MGSAGTRAGTETETTPEDVSAEDPAARERELRESMLAYQRGELSGFEALYRRLAPKLRGYLSFLSWDGSLTEDLLQETFLQMHRSRHTYLPPRPVQPWAFAIARHVYLMHRRARARRSKYEVGGFRELPDVPVPPAVEKLATRSAVMQALSQLTEDRREAVLLHHVWGFSYGEMGALLGIREGTAKLRAHRALHALRELLDAELRDGKR